MLTPTTYFLTFNETELNQLWLRENGTWAKRDEFARPVTTRGMGKVYIFADESWPFYVGKTIRSVSGRIRGAFRLTPEKRSNGFAGYRFKRDKTSAFLHVFMGTKERPWSDTDAECIEAEEVFRIRQAGSWPVYQTEIHFSTPKPVHTAAADGIIAYFQHLKSTQGVPLPADT